MRTTTIAYFSACFALGFALYGQDAKVIKDDFSDPKSPVRSATRGEWKYENNEASCISDPELYKKFSNHGPIVRWPIEFVDGTASFEMKAAECQRIVFTLNGEGHVFRVIIFEDPKKPQAKSRIIAWATKSSKTNKGDSVQPEGIPKVSGIAGKWIPVKLVVKDGKGNLTIGEFTTEIDHAALKRKKKEVTLSFASGNLTIRNFEFSKP